MDELPFEFDDFVPERAYDLRCPDYWDYYKPLLLSTLRVSTLSSELFGRSVNDVIRREFRRRKHGQFKIQGPV